MRVLFYLTSSGRSPIREFINELEEATQLEIIDALSLLESGQKLEMPLSRNLSSIKPGLHELRFRNRAGQVRLVYYVKKTDAIYLVHAFHKKTQTLLQKEVEIILKRIRGL